MSYHKIIQCRSVESSSRLAVYAIPNSTNSDAVGKLIDHEVQLRYFVWGICMTCYDA